MGKIRTILIICMIVSYLLLGIVDLKNHNTSTGIAAFLLAIVNGLLFLAGAK